MKLIRVVSYSQIVEHLKTQRNSIDNLESTRGFTYYYEVELEKEDFFGLIFLENNEVIRITKGTTRKLSAITKMALEKLSNKKMFLSNNWQLDKIYEKTIEKMDNTTNASFNISPIIIINTESGLYIQDGNHRCLGYAMYLLRNQKSYIPQKAFYCSNE